MFRFLIPAIAVLIVCTGCTVSKKETTAVPEQAQPEVAQSTPEVSDVNLEELQGAYDDAKSAFEADDAESEGYISSAVEYGMAVMNSPQLAPRTKYPLSLAVFKEVLVVDPENGEATDASKMIVEIYGSMGREVPEGAVEDFPLDILD